MATQEEALRIVTSTSRRKIQIDDATFEILDLRELTLAQKARALRVSASMVKMAKGELGDTEVADLSGSIDALVKTIVLKITDEVFSKLLDDDKCQIIFSFCAAKGMLAPKETETSQPIN